MTAATQNEFKYNDKKYICKKPSQAEILKAQHIAAITFANAFRNGVLTSAEAERIAEERGILGDDFKEKAKDLEARQADAQAALFSTESTSEEKEAAKIVLYALNDERVKLVSVRENLMANTCEGISRTEYLGYLICCCTYHEDGRHVWGTVDPKTKKTTPDYEKFLDEQDSDLVSTALIYVMSIESNIDAAMFEQISNGDDLIDRLAEIADNISSGETKIDSIAEAAVSETATINEPIIIDRTVVESESSNDHPAA